MRTEKAWHWFEAVLLFLGVLFLVMAVLDRGGKPRKDGD